MAFDDFMEVLPRVLPVFKNHSSILLPRAQLPVAISESDYAETSSEVFEGNLVAIIQPTPLFPRSVAFQPKPFETGCVGKITEVTVAGSNVNINIQGVCRFDVVGTLFPDCSGCERVVVDYTRYAVDVSDVDNPEESFERKRLMTALEVYFKRLSISPNWQEIEKTPVDVLISALAMACPFHPSEKQSLLETVDLKDRADMITKLIEMNSFDRFHTSNMIN